MSRELPILAKDKVLNTPLSKKKFIMDYVLTDIDSGLPAGTAKYKIGLAVLNDISDDKKKLNKVKDGDLNALVLHIRFEWWRRNQYAAEKESYVYESFLTASGLGLMPQTRPGEEIETIVSVYTTLVHYRATPVRWVAPPRTTAILTKFGSVLESGWPVEISAMNNPEHLLPPNGSSEARALYAAVYAFVEAVRVWHDTTDGYPDTHDLVIPARGAIESQPVTSTPQKRDAPTTPTTSTTTPSTTTTVTPVTTVTSTPVRSLTEEQRENKALRDEIERLRKTVADNSAAYTKTFKEISDQLRGNQTALVEAQSKASRLEDEKSSLQQLVNVAAEKNNRLNEDNDALKNHYESLKRENEQLLGDSETLRSQLKALSNGSQGGINTELASAATREQQLVDDLRELRAIKLYAVQNNELVQTGRTIGGLPNLAYAVAITSDEADRLDDTVVAFSALRRALMVTYERDATTRKWVGSTDDAVTFDSTYGNKMPDSLIDVSEARKLLNAANSGNSTSTALSTDELVHQDQFSRLASGQFGTNRVQATFRDENGALFGTMEVSRLDSRQAPDLQHYLVANLDDAETPVRYAMGAQGNKIPRRGSVTLRVYDRGAPVKDVSMSYDMDTSGALNARQMTSNDAVSLYSTGLSGATARLNMLVIAY